MWYYRGEEFKEDITNYDSFVYLITRLKNDYDFPKYYIGKKTFWFKGKKESDWMEYYGSSKDLKELIEIEGKENYRREIIHLCKSKGEAFILEAKEQLKNNVLTKRFPNGVKVFFNKNILGKYTKEYFTDDELMQLMSSDNLMCPIDRIWITNGEESKIIHKDEDIPEGWEKGNHYSRNVIWVNNGKEERKIPIMDAESFEYRYWEKGRLSSKNKNKIAVYKEESLIYIEEKEISVFEANGWKKGNNKIKSLDERNKIYVCNDETKEQRLIDRDKVREFLDKNPLWRIGQFKRGNFTTSGLVPAIDIETGEKVMIPSEEYKNNKRYVSRRTRKVKVKKKNRIVFIGYLRNFYDKFDVPKGIFNRYLRENNTNYIEVKKGKYKFITDERWQIIQL